MKALILYTNTGAGHVSACKAISEALQSLEVKTIEIDTLDFAGKSTSRNIENTYVNIVKNKPDFFKFLYNAGSKISNPKIKSIIYILNTVYSNKIYEFIEEENPDLIICTHIFCTQTISYIKNKHSLKAITSAIITDYTCAPFWEETSLDYYFIPHKDLINEFVSKGMDKNKLIAFGLPVCSKFRIHKNKSLSKEALNLNPNLPHILIMGGSMGAGNIYETFLALYDEFKNVQFTVICGSNSMLYKKFNDINLNSNIHILQFTDNIDELMDASDILISKPGGLTSTEAMVKGLPLIMINPIPGVESANSDFFSNHKAAIASNSIQETIESCRVIINDSKAWNDLISAQKNTINANAALDISNFLIDKLKSR